MGRKREVLVDLDEDIVAYEHHLAGNFVRVLVGFGTAMPDGSFVPAGEQNFENFIVQGAAYDELMSATGTKPQGVFRKDDLWRFVDIGRANVLAERDKIAKEKEEADQIEQAILNVKSKNNSSKSV